MVKIGELHENAMMKYIGKEFLNVPCPKSAFGKIQLHEKMIQDKNLNTFRKLTSAGKLASKMVASFLLKMAKHSEAKSAKRKFASKNYLNFLILARTSPAAFASLSHWSENEATN